MSMSITVPAYFDPSGSTVKYWNDLVTAAAKVPLIVIFNPDSGPGKTPAAVKNAAAEYNPYIQKVQAAGGKVYGYIASRVGSDADGPMRSLSAVEADINAYVTNYKKLNGFFIDQMSNDTNASHISFYKSIYSFIKGLSSSYTVMGNPGSNVPAGYATPWPQTADQFVLFEDTKAKYTSYKPESWQNSMPTSRFVHMVYGETQSDLKSALSLAVKNKAGSVYLTTNNAYNTLPSYWNDLVADVAAMN